MYVHTYLIMDSRAIGVDLRQWLVGSERSAHVATACDQLGTSLPRERRQREAVESECSHKKKKNGWAK